MSLDKLTGIREGTELKLLSTIKGKGIGAGDQRGQESRPCMGREPGNPQSWPEPKRPREDPVACFCSGVSDVPSFSTFPHKVLAKPVLFT